MLIDGIITTGVRHKKGQYLVLSIDLNQLLNLVKAKAMTSERFGEIIFNSLQGDELSMIGLKNNLHFLKPLVIEGGAPKIVIFNEFGRPFNPMSVDVDIPTYSTDLPKFINSLEQVLNAVKQQLEDQKSLDTKDYNSRLGGHGIQKI